MESREQNSADAIQNENMIKSKALLLEVLKDEVKNFNLPSHYNNYRDCYLSLHRFTLIQCHMQLKEDGNGFLKEDSSFSSIIEPDWYEGTNDIWMYANHLGHFSILRHLLHELKYLFRDIPATVTSLERLKSFLEENNREGDYEKIKKILSPFELTKFPRIIFDFPYFLVNARADWSSDIKDETTPLMLAVKRDDYFTAQFLLSNGAVVWGEISEKQKIGTALSYALLHSKERDSDLIKSLLRRVKRPIDPINMRYALQKSRGRAITFFITCGILPSIDDLHACNLAENDTRFTFLLRLAPKFGSYKQQILEVLAYCAIDKDYLGWWKAIIKAGIEYNPNIYLYIDKQARMNTEEAPRHRIFQYVYMPNKTTAQQNLHFAILQDNHRAVLNYLALDPSLVNEPIGEQQKVPLLVAYEANHYPIMNTLLARGADLNTTLMAALQKNDLGMIAMLSQYLTDLSMRHGDQDVHNRKRDRREYEDTEKEKQSYPQEPAFKRVRSDEENKDILREEITEASGPILNLPDEILSLIFEYLSIRDLINAGLVNSWFHAVAQEERLWKLLFLQYYPQAKEGLLDYRLALSQRLTEQFPKKIEAFLLSHQKEGAALLLSCLRRNDIKSLKENFSSYSSVENILVNPATKTHNALLIKQIFGKLSYRLAVNPNYQLGLDYLHELISSAIAKGGMLASSYLLIVPAMRAILFHRPIQACAIQDLSNCYLSHRFSNGLEYWDSPAFLAATLGNLEYIKCLHELGVDLNKQLIYPEMRTINPPTCGLINIAAHNDHHHLFAYLQKVLKDVDMKEACLLAYRCQDMIAFSCFLAYGVEIDSQKILEHGLPFLRSSIVSLMDQYVHHGLSEENKLLAFKRLLAALPEGEIDKAPSASAGNVYWLHLAAGRGDSKMLALLLDKGALVDREFLDDNQIRMLARNGKTPLMFASHLGHLEIVKILVEKGAQIGKDCGLGSEPFPYKKTPLNLAIATNHPEIADYLYDIQYKNNIPIEKEDLQHLFFYVARKGFEKMISWLINHGIDDINKRNFQGNTALMIAIEKNHSKVITLLRNLGAKENPCSSSLFSHTNTLAARPTIPLAHAYPGKY